MINYIMKGVVVVVEYYAVDFREKFRLCSFVMKATWVRLVHFLKGLKRRVSKFQLQFFFKYLVQFDNFAIMSGCCLSWCHHIYLVKLPWFIFMAEYPATVCATFL